jgi:DNA-binding transcriptional ArsR family regulator
VLQVRLDAASASRVRVAVSPLFETVAWLGLTVSGRRHPVFGDPGPAARFALRDPEVAAAAMLVADWISHRSVPDFLTPAPAPSDDAGLVLEAQLERVRSTAPVEAHAQLVGPRWSGRSIERSGLAGDRLPAVAASGLSKFWRQCLAADWPELERRTTVPLVRYGELMARGGLTALANAIHPDLSWRGDSLWLGCASPELRCVRLDDQELVLVPSLLTLPHLSVQLDDPAGAFVCFPAASDHRSGPSTSPRAGRVLGRGRTEVLGALTNPSTTRTLARQIGLGESTVSHHLQILLQAGLVDRSREGRSVTYVLTSDGRHLLDALHHAR